MRLWFIILSQFLSGSIWFAGNVAHADQDLLLSAVQIGFIFGSLVFAFFNLPDRFSPARVFFLCALCGAFFNTCGFFIEAYKSWLLMTRLCCGICLAGVYPVGMKIAASWYPQTISRALGWLVGALVLASGFPYLIRALSWQSHSGFILLTTSLLCLSGGLIAFKVGDGPHLPKGTKLDLFIIKKIFSHPGFKASSFGYFGHMWELYAVFAYIPLLLATIVDQHIDFWSFGFFVAGFLGCAAGGMVALKTGSRIIAMTALFISASACLLSPVIGELHVPIALVFVMTWGVAVAADSPQFSALNTRFAPKDYVGSALTIVNCIGFLITIITIELINLWISRLGIQTAFLPLAVGPIFGWISMKKYRERR
ncbi:MAG: MFS transporter [Desulfobacterales bacterium]|nr:MFS transporter [Desulfobacterales bacterium]